ncbi:hypothetical protein [Streptomyces sp. SID13031]|uniref:hypothetical protein n=1 Tax=Streptomyces sp. SID13031 TaxID=2706046 RepID=UPI0013C6DF22|nr:hypothetical protein [Streptomyces sp. SID13031]NEA34572.1 hypothetical protein [Streptomyces sp. SID13031]
MTIAPRLGVTTGVRRSAMTAAATAVMSVPRLGAMSAVHRSVTTVVGTAVTSAVRPVVMTGVRRSGMTVAATAVMSVRRRAVRLGGMIVVRLSAMTVAGIRVGRGLRRLGMVGLLASRVARGPGRGVMTVRGLCLGGMSGPGTRSRLLAMTVDRVGMTGPGLGVKSVVAGGGTTVSVAVVAPDVRTKRRSVRAGTTRSFRSGSPVRSSTRG